MQGQPVDCGANIRLNHAATGNWLHSHNIPGHFGQGNEVTCFPGSDDGDIWTLECGESWNIGSAFRLRHMQTGMYLAINSTSELPKEEGGGFEVYASEQDEGNEWSIAGGLFVGEDY